MTFANPLSPDASAKLERLLSHIDSHSLSDAQLNELQRVLLASEFAAEQFAKYGDIAVFWQELSEPFSEAALTLDDFMPLDEPAVMAKMRIWRNRWQCKLICWQVLGQLDTKELILRATLIAECAIDFASRWAYQTLTAQFGLPQTCKYSKQPQQLVVFAMGKLGARELNLSSDIDLIFAYSKEGETHNEQPQPTNDRMCIGPHLGSQRFAARPGTANARLDRTPDSRV